MALVQHYEFAEDVGAFSSIFDPQLRNETTENARREAWQALADKYAISVSQARLRWKAVRAYYKKHFFHPSRLLNHRLPFLEPILERELNLQLQGNQGVAHLSVAARVIAGAVLNDEDLKPKDDDPIINPATSSIAACGGHATGGEDYALDLSPQRAAKRRCPPVASNKLSLLTALQKFADVLTRQHEEQMKRDEKNHEELKSKLQDILNAISSE